MRPWQRWREPLAVVLLVVSTLQLVLRAVSVALSASVGDTGGLWGSVSGGDDLLLLGTAAAVLWCLTPLPAAAPAGAAPSGAASPGNASPGNASPGNGSPGNGDADTGSGRAEERATVSPHAWPIAVTGVVVVGLTVLGRLAVTGLDVVNLVSWPTPDAGFVLLVAEGVLRLAIPVVSLVAVIIAVHRAAANRDGVGQESIPAVASTTAHVPEVEAAPERLPAAWQADEATGAVWLTADDAAEGRPGLSWSEPSGPATSASLGWTSAPPAGSSTAGSSTAGSSTAGSAGPEERPLQAAGTSEQTAAPKPQSAAQDDDLH